MTLWMKNFISSFNNFIRKSREYCWLFIGSWLESGRFLIKLRIGIFRECPDESRVCDTAEFQDVLIEDGRHPKEIFMENLRGERLEDGGIDSALSIVWLPARDRRRRKARFLFHLCGAVCVFGIIRYIC